VPNAASAVKAVADTNVLVSGLLWSGPPASLLDRGALRLIGLVTSDEILAELEDVLSRPHLVGRLRLRGQMVAGVMQTYRAVAQIVEPAPVELPAGLRDPNDLHVLRCAVGANVDAIITGDKDLLVLKEFVNIAIVTPRQFLASIGM
jgi:putative PIN family toxin of toxin-antitoxin system